MELTERRKALFYGLALSLTLIASPVHAFGLKTLTDAVSGGGGGGSWTKIVTDWRDGLGGLGKQAAIIGYAISDLTKALGHKELAATIRKQAQTIEEKGDSVGAEDMGAMNDAIEEGTKKCAETLKNDGAKLDAKTKAKVGEALTKYIPGVAGAIPHGVKLFQASQQAASAPTPKVSDLKAVKVAAQIPQLMPNIVTFIQAAVEGGNKLREVAKEAKLPSGPDTKLDMSEMM